VLPIYNETHGIIGDLIEVGWNKGLGEYFGLTTAAVGEDVAFAKILKEVNDNAIIDPYGHSQGGHETYLMVAEAPGLFTGSWVQLSGAPVNKDKAIDQLTAITGVEPIVQINEGDFVPTILGNNAQSVGDAFNAIGQFPALFTDESPHSHYPCTICTTPRPAFDPSLIKTE
jgi:hypothetical protein